MINLTPTKVPVISDSFEACDCFGFSIGTIHFTEVRGPNGLHGAYAFKPSVSWRGAGYEHLQEIVDELKRLNKLRGCGY